MTDKIEAAEVADALADSLDYVSLRIPGTDYVLAAVDSGGGNTVVLETSRGDFLLVVIPLED